MRLRSIVLAATLLLPAAAQATVTPLPTPNLADRDFRNGTTRVEPSYLSVLGFGIAGATYVAGAFDSVDGQARDGVARLNADGTLDPNWAPVIPHSGMPLRVVESELGGAAFVYTDQLGGQSVAHVAPGASLASGPIALNGTIHAVAFDPAGNLYVAFSPSQPIESQNPAPVYIEKWDQGSNYATGFALTLSGQYVPCPGVSVAPKVRSMIALDGMLYVGGDFLAQTNPRGAWSVPGAMRISTATGDVDPSWTPLAPVPAGNPGETCPALTGVSRVIEAPANHVYLVGHFAHLGGSDLGRFSRIAPGARDATWNPASPTASGFLGAAVDINGRYLYVVAPGPFTAGGESRGALAAYSTGPDAALVPWDLPMVFAHLHSTPERLLVGGYFTSIEGVPRSMLAGLRHAWQVGPASDWDADGMPNAIDSASGRDPTVKDNDVFTDPWLFASQQYRDFLAREGDLAGITFWREELDFRRSTRAQMALAFLQSGEFRGAIAPVARLYFAYFLRVPDYEGISHWIGSYRAGNSLQSISQAFAASAEFTARYGALDNSQFVDRVYQNVLGRPADATGLAHWKGQLDSGALTRGQVMLAFSESAEYRALIDADVLVTMSYMGMLRRAPDASGFSFWVGYVDQGNSPLALIEGFLASTEYRKRFLP